MPEITVKNQFNNNITISLIGTFKIPILEKEFIIYSLVDDNPDNLEGEIMLGEIIRKNKSIQVVGIESEEKDLVVAFYNEISKQLGDEVYG